MDESWDGHWHDRLPELECVANAVSLTMPYVEPFVIRAVGVHLGGLDDEVARRARGYLAQETAHQRIHRQMNVGIQSGAPTARLIDATTRWCFAKLRRYGSTRFALAFAAAAEALAYLTARWVASHHGTLFAGADPAIAELYLWHLAEEVEHKDVARSVFDQVDGSRMRYCGGLVVALVVLGTAATLGTAMLLADRRRLHHPKAWVRLNRWGWSYVFDVLPSLGATISKHHRPDDFVDPSWFSIYLARFPSR